MTLLRRWWPAAFMALAAVFFAVVNLANGHVAVGLVVGLLLLAVAFVFSPLLFPHGPGWADGQRWASVTGVPLILWKPNCSYCIRMRLALGIEGRRAIWVDIERDPEAAAQTRLRNDGNETTPTVITPRETRTNPSPAWVRGQLPAGRPLSR